MAERERYEPLGCGAKRRSILVRADMKGRGGYPVRTEPYYNPGTYLVMFGNVIRTFGRHTLRMGVNFEYLRLGDNSGGKVDTPRSTL